MNKSFVELGLSTLVDEGTTTAYGAVDQITAETVMRRTFFAFALATAPTIAVAQQRDSTLDRQSLPRDVREEVVGRWNAPSAIRSSERVDIEDGREVRGNVAVQRGPLVLAGHVTGNVLAVNSDVLLRPTARIDGDLLVVGGEVEGRNTAYIGGEIRIYRQSLRYRQEGDQIVADREPEEEREGWWRRLERRGTRSWSDPVRIAQAGPYNRVEGLPVSVGPAIYERRAWGSFHLEAAAVVRTGSSFASEDSDVGHNVRGELRFGRRQGAGIGGRVFNVVEPVESWQLSSLEVALASFLFHRDYQDYFQRHGASGFVTLFSSRDATLTGSLSDERWTSRGLNDPFTLFYNADEWRPNPLVDEGRFHLTNATLRIDTRTDPDEPWSGWYVDADLEGGRGQYTAIAPTSAARPVQVGDLVSYSRGFLDVRRYNRLSPYAQINLRAVVGGWLTGDPMPVQRRLSVDGPGSLPGFDFRSDRGGVDVGSCNTGLPVLGRPAQCDRIALAQIEYRGDIAFDFGDWDDGPHYRHRAGRATAAWVVFVDAGRGWLVGDQDAIGAVEGLTYERDQLPPLSSFRSDVGIGLDFGGFGVYAAKSVSTPSQPGNFFVRLRHRF
jgi:hypothetical protein